MPDDRETRQWQYEHGERRLPQAPRAIGNWSLAGILWRLLRRRRDRLDDAAKRMREGPQPPG